MRRLSRGVSLGLVLLCVVAIVSAAEAQQKLLVGVSGPFSGAGAAWGAGWVRGIELAVKHVNERGGIKVGKESYVIELITKDNKYLTDAAVTVAQNLIEKSKVKYLCTMGGGPVGATVPLGEAAKILQLDFTWAHPKHYPGDGTFQFSIHTMFSVPHIVNMIIEQNPKVKRFVSFNDNQPMGKAAFEEQRKAVEAANCQVADSILYEPGTTDFYPLATKILAAKPDALLSSAKPGDFALLLKALREMGFWGPVGAHTFAPALKLVSPKNAEGVLTDDYDPKGAFLTETYKKLAVEYEKAYGEPIVTQTNLGWDHVMALRDGMVAAGSTNPQKIAKALEEGAKFESLGGLTSFSQWKPNRVLSHFHNTFVIISQVRDGKIVNVKDYGSPVIKD